MVVNRKNINWNNDVKYDVVQFNLVNPTSLPVSINLFNTQRITRTQVTPTVFAPVANQAQQSVSGTSPVINGMGYLPSLNYMFMSDVSGKRIVWDVTNKVQISEYIVAASTMYGNIIERPSDGLLWGSSGLTSFLIQSDWVAMTQTLFPVTGLPANSGVYYDDVTDTLFFGYNALFLLGTFDLTTNTLVDISTPDTFNRSLAIDVTNRKIYCVGFSPSGAVVTEVNMDTKTVTATYDFTATGLTILTHIGLDPNTGNIYGIGESGLSSFVGLLNLSTLSFTTITSGVTLTFGRFLNLAFINNTMFVYSTSGADSITTINTISNTIVDNRVSVGGTILLPATAYLLLVPDQYIYASKGTTGTIAGDLTEFPVTQNFYISGSIDYNFFVESIFTAPKRVFAIEINTNFTALFNEWVITRKDANGQQCSVPYLPNNYTTNFQFDSRESLITFEDGGYIMDITSDSRYTVPANTTVTILLYYKEMSRSQQLIKTKDFSNDSGAFAASVVNQQEQTGIEIMAQSGRNIYNYWTPSTVMVDNMIEQGAYPKGWKDMEKMIPASMVIDNVIGK